ncbi:hypothetical protein ROLI_028810 [Roseobacter fucihabitans]|uniref:Uncharacterized protein n=1 Tax=Roseobacter fucihabitans TaxID=1537242 RepID=A0ABZ2BUQ4_9RHOB|nr:hypothetical protein [Roseobacter litoralis]
MGAVIEGSALWRVWCSCADALLTALDLAQLFICAQKLFGTTELL